MEKYNLNKKHGYKLFNQNKNVDDPFESAVGKELKIQNTEHGTETQELP